MAITTSQIDDGLDSLSGNLAAKRAALGKIHAQLTQMKEDLASMQTSSADLRLAVDGLTGVDEWETAVKARKDRLVAEFTDTDGVIDAALGDLSGVVS